MIETYNFLETHMSNNFHAQYTEFGFCFTINIIKPHRYIQYHLFMLYGNVWENLQSVGTYFVYGQLYSYDICKSKLMDFLNYMYLISTQDHSAEDQYRYLRRYYST